MSADSCSSLLTGVRRVCCAPISQTALTSASCPPTPPPTPHRQALWSGRVLLASRPVTVLAPWTSLCSTFQVIPKSLARIRFEFLKEKRAEFTYWALKVWCLALCLGYGVTPELRLSPNVLSQRLARFITHHPEALHDHVTVALTVLFCQASARLDFPFCKVGCSRQ